MPQVTLACDDIARQVAALSAKPRHGQIHVAIKPKLLRDNAVVAAAFCAGKKLLGDIVFHVTDVIRNIP